MRENKTRNRGSKTEVIKTGLLGIITFLLAAIAFLMVSEKSLTVQPALNLGRTPAVYWNTHYSEVPRAAPPVSEQAEVNPVPTAGLMDGVEKGLYISVRFLVKLLTLLSWILARALLYVGMASNTLTEVLILQYGTMIEAVATDFKPIVRAMAGLGLLLAAITLMTQKFTELAGSPLKFAKFPQVLLWGALLGYYLSSPVFVYETMEEIRVSVGDTVLDAMTDTIDMPDSCEVDAGHSCSIDIDDELYPIPAGLGACMAGGHIQNVKCGSITALPTMENTTLEAIPGSVDMEDGYSGTRSSLDAYFRVKYQKNDKEEILEWALKGLIRSWVTLGIPLLVAMAGLMNFSIGIVGGIVFILLPVAGAFAFFELFDIFPKRLAMLYVSLIMTTAFVYALIGAVFKFMDLAMSTVVWGTGGAVVLMAAIGMLEVMAVWPAMGIPFSAFRGLMDLTSGVASSIASRAGSAMPAPSAQARQAVQRARMMARYRSLSGRRRRGGGLGKKALQGGAKAMGAVTGPVGTVAGAAVRGARKVLPGGDGGGNGHDVEPATQGVAEEARERMGYGGRYDKQREIRDYLTGGDDAELPHGVDPETQARLVNLRQNVANTENGEEILQRLYDVGDDASEIHPPVKDGALDEDYYALVRDQARDEIGDAPDWTDEALSLGAPPKPVQISQQRRRRVVREGLKEDAPEDMRRVVEEEAQVPWENVLGRDMHEDDLAQTMQGIDPEDRERMWDIVVGGLDQGRDTSPSALRRYHGDELVDMERRMADDDVPLDEARGRIDGALEVMEEAALSQPEPMFRAPRRLFDEQFRRPQPQAADQAQRAQGQPPAGQPQAADQAQRAQGQPSAADQAQRAQGQSPATPAQPALGTQQPQTGQRPQTTVLDEDDVPEMVDQAQRGTSQAPSKRPQTAPEGQPSTAQGHSSVGPNLGAQDTSGEASEPDTPRRRRRQPQRPSPAEEAPPMTGASPVSDERGSKGTESSPRDQASGSPQEPDTPRRRRRQPRRPSPADGAPPMTGATPVSDERRGAPESQPSTTDQVSGAQAAPGQASSETGAPPTSGERDEETGERAGGRGHRAPTGQPTPMPREETPQGEARADEKTPASDAEQQPQAADTSGQPGQGVDTLWGEAAAAPEESTTQQSAQPVTEPSPDRDGASASGPASGPASGADQAEETPSQQEEAPPSQRPSRNSEVSPAPRAAIDPGMQDGAQPGRATDASADGETPLPEEDEDDFPALRTWLNSEGVDHPPSPTSDDAENRSTRDPGVDTEEQSE